MTNLKRNPEDRVREEYGTKVEYGMEYMYFSFMEKIKKCVGEPKCGDGKFSLEQHAEYFQCEDDPSNYVRSTDDEEEQELYWLFNNLSAQLHELLYQRELASEQLKGIFTSQQLACLFQAYKGVSVCYEKGRITDLEEVLYKYLNTNDELTNGLDIPEFKSVIESINPVILHAFVNKIKELRDADEIVEVISLWKKD
nr:hypothetical protein [uncultured Draconibacterium sp.]